MKQMKHELKCHWTPKSLFWGILFICAAVLLILGELGLHLSSELAPWRIALGILCLSWLIKSILKLRFASAVFPLAFLFFLFEPLIARLVGSSSDNLISNWAVLFATLLLSIGLNFILPEKLGGGLFSVDYTKSTLYLDGAELKNTRISDHAGSTIAYISNPEVYAGDGTIRITDNVGKVTLHIPATWNVILNRTDNIGRVNISERKNNTCEKNITVMIYDNIGSVNIVYD